MNVRPMCDVIVGDQQLRQDMTVSVREIDNNLENCV